MEEKLLLLFYIYFMLQFYLEFWKREKRNGFLNSPGKGKRVNVSNGFTLELIFICLVYHSWTFKSHQWLALKRFLRSSFSSSHSLPQLLRLTTQNRKTKRKSLSWKSKDQPRRQFWLSFHFHSILWKLKWNVLSSIYIQCKM